MAAFWAPLFIQHSCCRAASNTQIYSSTLRLHAHKRKLKMTKDEREMQEDLQSENSGMELIAPKCKVMDMTHAHSVWRSHTAYEIGGQHAKIR
jgi:hypothetical protein